MKLGFLDHPNTYIVPQAATAAALYVTDRAGVQSIAIG